MEHSESTSFSGSGLTTRRNSTGSLASRYLPRLNSCNKLEHHIRALGIDLEAAAEDEIAYKKEKEIIYGANRPKIPFKHRLRHFTWAWYTLPMSTGGLALLIKNQQASFPQLPYIGYAFYILAFVFFVSISVLMAFRFYLFPGSFTTSIGHSREGFFLPTAFLAVATLITNTEKYVIPNAGTSGTTAMRVLFWIYVSTTLCLAIGQYSFIFAKHSLSLQTMMPTWILPIFPIMLSGTIASVIAHTQPETSAMSIIIAGLTCQGLGLSVAIFMYAHMIGRLMMFGLPNREHRPGLYMCVGPPAFTAIAFIGMAKALPADFDSYGEAMPLNTVILGNIAVMAAVFLWALSLWWFGIATVAVIMSPPRYFHLGCWATVFPNVGFVLASISIAKEIGNESVLWVTTGMSIVIFLVYVFVFYQNARAVVVQDIMYEGHDEDFAE